VTKRSGGERDRRSPRFDSVNVFALKGKVDHIIGGGGGPRAQDAREGGGGGKGIDIRRRAWTPSSNMVGVRDGGLLGGTTETYRAGTEKGWKIKRWGNLLQRKPVGWGLMPISRGGTKNGLGKRGRKGIQSSFSKSSLKSMNRSVADVR